MNSWALRLASRLSGLFRQKKADSEFDCEMQTHLQFLTEKFIWQGMGPEDADSSARRQFGNTTLLRQRHRESRTFLSFSTVVQDVRYGLRVLGKSRGFTAIAATSLTLAIGANTAIFSIAKSVLYDRLNAAHADELRMLRWNGDANAVVQSMWGDFDTSWGNGITASVFSYPVYLQLRDHSQAMQDLLAYKEDSMNATIRGNAQQAVVAMVSGNYFDVLGVPPQLGRNIQPSDDHVGNVNAVAVISDGLWERAFGRSPSALGQTINVNQSLLTVVGIAPRGFTGAKDVQSSPDVFVPLSMQPMIDPKGENESLLDDPDMWWVNITGRSKAGVSDAQAQAELNVALTAAVRGTMAVKAGDTGVTALGSCRWQPRPSVRRADVQEACLCAHDPHRICAAVGVRKYRKPVACARRAAAAGDERAASTGRWARTTSATDADGESSAGWDWRHRWTAPGLSWPQCDS